MKKISKYLNILAIILVIIFLVMLAIDYFRYDSYSTSFPFYTYIILRGVEFLIPSIILFIISKILKNKKWLFNLLIKGGYKDEWINWNIRY